MDNTKLIAPCGMNCALCMAYQREKNHCPGCNGPDEGKLKSCINCKIKNCENLEKLKYCYKCEEFPCTRIKNLDKRYRTKYGMSMIENLNAIKTKGIENFLEEQTTRWSCSKCSSLLCVHRKSCQMCGTLKI